MSRCTTPYTSAGKRYAVFYTDCNVAVAIKQSIEVITYSLLRY